MKSIKQTITFIILTSIIGSSPLQAMLSRVSRTFGNTTRDTARNTLQSRSFSRAINDRPSALRANHTRIIAQAMLPQISQTRAYSNTIKSNPQSKALFSRAPHASNTYMFVPKRKWHPTNNYSLIILQKIKLAYIPETTTYKDIRHFFSENQLEKLLNDEEIVPIVTLVATQNFNALANDWQGRGILEMIMQHNPDAAKKFTPLAVQNFNAFANGWKGRDTLEMIIQHNPDAAKAFTQLAAQNFNALAKDWDGRETLEMIMKRNPDAAKKFTQPAVQNFNALAKDWEGRDTLEMIIQRNPDAAKKFTPLAAQNFNTLAEDWKGREILKMIMKHNPDAAQIFTKLAIQNFNDLANWKTREVLENIMQHNPDAAKKFTPLANQNFDDLAKYWPGREVLAIITQLNFDAAKKFTQPAIENFICLAFDWLGREILEKIMNHNPYTVKAFTQLAAQNFNALAKDREGTITLEMIMKHNPDAAKEFTQLAAQNFNALAKDREGTITVEMIMKYNPDAAKEFTQPAAQSIQEINLSVLKKIIENNPHSAEIKEALESLIFNGNQAISSLDKIIKKVLYHKYFNAQDSSTNLSQTEQHMFANFETIYNHLDYFRHHKPALLNMGAYIINKEHNLHHQGYYTFIHGQRWEYQLAEQWYRFLWELRKQKPIQDYIFPHLKQEETNLDKEQKTRKRLIKYGRCHICLKNKSEELRQKILFMNYALFGNVTNDGSSSAYYFVANNNVGNIHISLEDVFRFNQYSSYYEKYKNKLNALEQEHKELSELGNMLLIAIPEDKLKDCVYLCGSGGYKRSIPIKNNGILAKLGIRFHKTNDIKTIMDTLRTNPEKFENPDLPYQNSDRLEFGMPMTWDLTLNPDSGIKIFNCNAADPEKLAEFNKKYDALFEEIKKDIERDRNNTMN